MSIRKAFTMIELIFVIVVMGILAKFGVEFLARAYESFLFSSTNNRLQSNSATAVEFIAKRLENRIKASVIVRENKNNAGFTALADANPGTQYLVLEWVSADIDGFRANDNPLWSGILDLDAGALLGNTTLVSPETNTGAINTLISTLSYGDSGINDAALYFIGADHNISAYGWNGVAITTQNAVMHPIKSNGVANQFEGRRGNDNITNSFAGVEVFEYYKLSWTANAIVATYNNADNIGNLEFFYDYQPWNGETYYGNGKSEILMEDISTFQAMAIGSIIKIQVCAKTEIILGENGEGEYSLCKEKTIY